MIQSTDLDEFMALALKDIAELKQQLADSITECGRWHNLTKELCEEMESECPDACNSYGHVEDCGAVSLLASFKHLRQQLADANARIKELMDIMAKSENEKYLNKDFINKTLVNYFNHIITRKN